MADSRAESASASSPTIWRQSRAATRQPFVEQTNSGLRELRASAKVVWRTLAGHGTWVLEIGCGHGHFLTDFARHHPDHRCLGVDFCRDRIRRAERKRSGAALINLCFLRAEARQFLTVIPPEIAFSQVFVLFPDPWPKRRHRKHRLVTSDFLNTIANVSAPRGRFHFRSDALDYAADVRGALERHARWRIVPSERLPFETASVFQQRAVQFETIVAEIVN